MWHVGLICVQYVCNIYGLVWLNWHGVCATRMCLHSPFIPVFHPLVLCILLVVSGVPVQGVLYHTSLTPALVLPGS